MSEPSADETPVVPQPPDAPLKNAPAKVGDMGVINRRMIVWGPDGVPRPESVPMLTPKNVEDIAATALSLPYKTDPLSSSDEEFVGMTNAEVMLVRMARLAAGGDLSAANVLLDRVLGRPKQSIESKNVNVSYADVLKEKADRAAKEGTVDCEVVQSPSPPSSPEDDPLGGIA